MKEGRKEGESQGETVVCARQGLWMVRVRSWRVRRDIPQRRRRSGGVGRKGSGETMGVTVMREDWTYAFGGMLPSVDDGVVSLFCAGSD